MSELRMEQTTLGPLETNCYLLGDTDTGQAVVVDPGAPEPALEELISGWDIVAIILTHAHWDHFGGVPRLMEIAKAPLMLGEGDLDLYRDPSSNLMALLGPGTKMPEPDRLLSPGSTIPLAQRHLEISAAPGHSPGGILITEGNLVFTGDTIFAGSVGRTDLPGGSGETLMQTLKREILSLPDETNLYPGHGPATTVGRERAFNPFLAEL